MDEINELLTIIDTLMGPNGCPWDKKQTMHSIRDSLLEETCETIEAIDSGDSVHICEELGDLFFNVIFLCRLAEKEGHTTLKDVVKKLSEKLISRHPHVFGSSTVSTLDGLKDQWELIKSTEKGKGKDIRTSILDGIPKALPALARAQKVLKKIEKVDFKLSMNEKKNTTEELVFGKKLFDFVTEANASGIEAELALRCFLEQLEITVRNQEK